MRKAAPVAGSEPNPGGIRVGAISRRSIRIGTALTAVDRKVRNREKREKNICFWVIDHFYSLQTDLDIQLFALLKFFLLLSRKERGWHLTGELI